ncbi:MAG: LysR family transcriptional regulator [Myxococcaceae bacterium]|nr:LysR family transcriptional regulator [Myxococcaceae bacterium]
MNPHPFTLRQLQYAVAVADALSFRRAAERCHVSQPSLSAQLAQLEGVLGVRLFERDRRRVLPTTAGRDLVDRARRLLVAADEVQAAASGFIDPLSGVLRLGVIPTVSPYLLPDVTPALHRTFKRLNLRWLEDKTHALVAALDEGRVDGALLALEADLGDVEHEVIAIDRFVLVSPPDHELGRGQGPVTAAELREQPVLLLDDGHCFRAQALDVCTKSRAHELEFRATSLTTLVQMVAGGAGLTLLPSLAVAAELKRSKLKVRPVNAPGAQRTIALVWRKKSPLAAPLKQVAAVIRDAWP